MCAKFSCGGGHHIQDLEPVDVGCGPAGRAPVARDELREERQVETDEQQQSAEDAERLGHRPLTDRALITAAYTGSRMLQPQRPPVRWYGISRPVAPSGRPGHNKKAHAMSSILLHEAGCCGFVHQPAQLAV